MKLDKIKFTSISPSDYNPRKMNRDEMNILSKNLEEFGLVDPIIINLKNNHIIGGHQRYTALKKKYKKSENLEDLEFNVIKLGDIGWVFESDELTIEDETHEKALNLALNKISGTWEYDKLSSLLKELNNDMFDINLTGFDAFEIEKYTIPTDLNLQFTEIDDIKEGKRKPNESIGTLSEQTENYDEPSENDDENDVLVSAEEIEKIHKHECPKCGYKW